jgi:hypothetical protein
MKMPQYNMNAVVHPLRHARSGCELRELFDPAK